MGMNLFMGYKNNRLRTLAVQIGFCGPMPTYVIYCRSGNYPFPKRNRGETAISVQIRAIRHFDYVD